MSLFFVGEMFTSCVFIKHGASILGCDISLPQDRPDFVICIENTAEDCDLVHDGNDDHPDQPIGTCNCFLDSHQCFEEWSCARSDWWWRSFKKLLDTKNHFVTDLHYGIIWNWIHYVLFFSLLSLYFW